MKRDVSIDLVKVLAIIGVVIIHSCNWQVELGTQKWIASLFWGTLTRGSVPLFLMSSGAVMLSGKKEVPLKKLYFKNILRVLTAMIFWSIIYKVYHLFMAENLSFNTFCHSVKEVLLFNREFHFYYIDMILIVYAFLPITKIFINNATKKQLQYAIILWVIFACIYPTLRVYYPFNMLGGVTGQWAVNLVYSSIGYGVLGYYLKEYGLPKWVSPILAVCGFLFIFFATYLMSMRNGYLYENFFDGTSVGVVALAVGIFTMVCRVKINNIKIKNVTIRISKSSFCIYLSHMLLIYFLKDRGVTVDFASYIISIPTFALGVAALSGGIYFVLSKIPIVKKWII